MSQPLTSFEIGPCDPSVGVHALAQQYYAIMQAAGEPVAQGCRDCGAVQHPPLLGCPRCASADLVWVGCGDTGVVGTFVTVHTTNPTPSMGIPRRLLDQVPYSSVYYAPTRFPEIRLAALMTGTQQEALHVGVTVRANVDPGDRAITVDLAE